jgi:hypothetical protein
MPSYLVETYLPRGRAEERAARERRARSADEEPTRGTTRVRSDCWTHVPENEIRFFPFDVAPIRVVGAVSSRKEKE